METCNRCGSYLPSGSAFCPYCGAAHVMAPPAPLTPYGREKKEADVAGRGFGIAGMILGIVGAFYGLIWFLSILSAMSIGGYASDYIATLLLTLGFPIMALCFSGKAQDMGYCWGMANAGTVLGSVGLGLHGLSFLFCMIL